MSQATATRAADFDVDGMTCGWCAARVQRVLGRQNGVDEARVNFATGRARVEWRPEAVAVEDLQAAVNRVDYRPPTRRWPATRRARNPRRPPPGSAGWRSPRR